jgi:hypothetical protein
MLLTCCIFASCKKEEVIQFPASPPVIGVLSLSADTLVEFQDSLIIELSYEDKNGDLGSFDPDIKDLEIKDDRLPAADFYHVIPLAPEGTTLFINGTLRLVLPPQFRLGNASIEQTSFNIRLRDRNGTWSESVRTDPVFIIQQ